MARFIVPDNIRLRRVRQMLVQCDHLLNSYAGRPEGQSLVEHGLNELLNLDPQLAPWPYLPNASADRLVKAADTLHRANLRLGYFVRQCTNQELWHSRWHPGTILYISVQRMFNRLTERERLYRNAAEVLRAGTDEQVPDPTIGVPGIEPVQLEGHPWPEQLSEAQISDLLHNRAQLRNRFTARLDLWTRIDSSDDPHLEQNIGDFLADRNSIRDWLGPQAQFGLRGVANRYMHEGTLTQQLMKDMEDLANKYGQRNMAEWIDWDEYQDDYRNASQHREKGPTMGKKIIKNLDRLSRQYRYWASDRPRRQLPKQLAHLKARYQMILKFDNDLETAENYLANGVETADHNEYLRGRVERLLRDHNRFLDELDEWSGRAPPVLQSQGLEPAVNALRQEATANRDRAQQCLAQIMHRIDPNSHPEVHPVPSTTSGYPHSTAMAKSAVEEKLREHIATIQGMIKQGADSKRLDEMLEGFMDFIDSDMDQLNAEGLGKYALQEYDRLETEATGSPAPVSDMISSGPSTSTGSGRGRTYEGFIRPSHSEGKGATDGERQQEDSDESNESDESDEDFEPTRWAGPRR